MITIVYDEKQHGTMIDSRKLSLCAGRKEKRRRSNVNLARVHGGTPQVSGLPAVISSS